MICRSILCIHRHLIICVNNVQFTCSSSYMNNNELLHVYIVVQSYRLHEQYL